jgi:hypothetical protein
MMDHHSGEIRMDLLRRLAEQAMSDPDFRAVARHDLDGALRQYGYDLNERELVLVHRFRAALEEAGIDLFLMERASSEELETLRQVFNDAAPHLS